MVITDSDVIRANDEFIRTIAHNLGRSLPTEERYAIALSGFLVAIRTYQKGLYPFRVYAANIMETFLRQARRKRAEQIRLESRLSLDQPIAEGGEPLLAFLPGASGDMFHVVMLHDFLDSLHEDFRATARLYINKYTSEEIMSILSLSQEDLEWHRASIRYYWEQYNLEADNIA